MRALFLFAALVIATSAQAGVMESCRDKEKENDKMRACVRGEQTRSLNRLREASVKAQEAITQEIRETGRKLSLREFRTIQAKHVRERRAVCSRRDGIEQVACEADMNYVQADKLAHFIKQ